MSVEGSIELLEQRVSAAAVALAQTMEGPPPSIPAEWQQRPVITTGLGSSQAAARLLVARLRNRCGATAQFRPLADFYSHQPVPEGAVLVVFSQGLSANSRIALKAVNRFSGCVLVTSVSLEGLAASGQLERRDYLNDLIGRGVKVLHHPLESEFTILPRIIGPLCAQAMAIRLAAELGGSQVQIPSELKDPMFMLNIGSHEEQFTDWVDDLQRGVEFNFANGAVEYAQNLAAKAMECLFVPTPPLRDLLEYSHGPFQTRVLSGRAQWIFHSNRAEELNLIDKMYPLFTTHGGVRLVSSPLPQPWDILYYELFLNRIMCHAVRTLGVDLVNWPGKGADGAGYQINQPYSEDEA